MAASSWQYISGVCQPASGQQEHSIRLAFEKSLTGTFDIGIVSACSAGDPLASGLSAPSKRSKAGQHVLRSAQTYKA